MNPTKKKARDAEIATLKRKLMEAEAQMAHVYHFVAAGLPKANRDRMAASGVLVRLHTLGGSEICPPFVIRGGLSCETIDALTADAKASYATATELRP